MTTISITFGAWLYNRRRKIQPSLSIILWTPVELEVQGKWYYIADKLIKTVKIILDKGQRSNIRYQTFYLALPSSYFYLTYLISFPLYFIVVHFLTIMTVYFCNLSCI